MFASLLTLPQSILLGLVEGITEFLPVSSTGHLLFVQELIGLGSNDAGTAADTYAIAVQFGAILAVLWLYRARIGGVVKGAVGRSDEGRRLLINLLVAFVPAAIIGVVAGDAIKDAVFGPIPIVIAWILGGVLLLVWVPKSGSIDLGSLAPGSAFLIGLAQVVAMWPGVSRSLSTLVAGLLLGLTLSAAVEFTFLLGLITLSAAAALDLMKHGGDLIDKFGLVSPIVGLAVAFVSALVSVRWMVGYLSSNSLRVFGWYRLFVGVVGMGLILTGAV
jgi:undecaprenyl-diphosphatase